MAASPFSHILKPQANRAVDFLCLLSTKFFTFVGNTARYGFSLSVSNHVSQQSLLVFTDFPALIILDHQVSCGWEAERCNSRQGSWRFPQFLPEVLAVFCEETPSNFSVAFALINFQMTKVVVFLKTLSRLVLFVGEIISLSLHFTMARKKSVSSGLVSQ